MEKKIIFYIGGFILPDGNAAAHRVLANAKILKALGYEVILIGVTKKKICKEILRTKSEIYSMIYYEINYPKNLKNLFSYISSIKVFKEVFQHYGINKIFSIILYNYPSIGFYKFLKFSNKFNIKIISDITEWYLANYGSFTFRCIKRIDNFVRVRYLNYKCSGVISISRFFYDMYKKNLETVLIPPLTDLEDVKWMNSNKKIGHKKKFIYVGNPGSKENFRTILIAFSRLSMNYDFQFDIVGLKKQFIVDKYPSLKKKIKILGNKVNFFNTIPHNECIRLIQRSHFFIFVRKDILLTKAGFPTKFVESISAGTPVITNKSSNIIDYLEPGENGFWLNDIENIDALERQLSEIVTMPNETINKMKKYCWESKLFDYKNYIEEVKLFMQNV